jgi:hypothetical protein
MAKKNAFIFICQSYQTAEKAVNALQKARFNVQRLSIIGRDHLGFIDAANAAPSDAKRDFLSGMFSFWDRKWRLLSGDAFINVEGIGPTLAAGPIAESMLSAWASPGFFQTNNPLRSVLRALGIAREDSAKYEAALQQERLLLIAQGKPSEILAAVRILKSCARDHSDRKQHVKESERVQAEHHP